MQDSKNVDLLAYVIHSYERQRCENELARALNSPRSPTVWKGLKGGYAIDDDTRHSTSGVWIRVRNVVADPLEVIGGIRRPTDAHHAR